MKVRCFINKLFLCILTGRRNHEENVRRLFYRWLSAARSVRHRRVTLQRKEDELKASATAATWNKWRERFVDEKLRPIVSFLSFH